MRHSLRKIGFLLLALFATSLWGNLSAQDVLFVSEDDPGSFGSGDQAIYNRLVGMGYTLTVKGSSSQPATSSHANGKDLVIISSTMNSSTINTMYRDVSVPVMVLESYLLDDMKMTTSSGYGIGSGMTQLEVLNASHDIAQPYSGTLTATSSGQSYRWGIPASSATKVAKIAGTTDEYAIFVYESGASMQGMNAPAIRLFFFLDNHTAAALNTDGWDLFDNSVQYAMGISGGTSVTTTRVTTDLVVLYDFKEGSGSTVTDVSGFGTPLNLSIEHPANTSWIAGQGLTINTGTIIKSAVNADKVKTACVSSDALTLEAWVKPANITQDGPARILTLSVNTGTRNFTLGQEDNDYVARLRTDVSSSNGGGDNNGMPNLSTNNGVQANTLQHIVFTKDANGIVKIYLDGVQVWSGTRNGDLDNWEDRKLGLANEFTMDRDWLGSLYLSAVYSKALSGSEVVQNFQAGPTGSTTTTVGNCVANGEINYARYENISGNSVSNLTSNAAYPNSPDHTSVLTSFEAPTNIADSYGVRMYGYLCPPQTGTYTFWVAGDDNVELWLSTDSDPTNKVKIAYHTSWTASQEWTKYTTQQSASVALEAGKAYYVEALMKEGSGGDNLAVGWQLPDASYDRPISGSYLSSQDLNSGSGTGSGSGEIESVCSLSPYTSGEHAIYLPISGLSSDYVWNSDGGTLTQYDNGTATIAGIVQNISNANLKWSVNYRLTNKRTYSQWTALGRGVKGAAHGDETTWDFYELDGTVSKLTGLGDNAGKLLNITHDPASFQYGFQVGNGANDKDSDYGMSGWFGFNGSHSGKGDVNVDAACTVPTPTVEEECYISNGESNRWVYMNDNASGVTTYTWDGSAGKIIKYSNGSANIQGTIVAVNDPNKKWTIDVWFQRKRNWAEWNALGRSYKANSWHNNIPVADANHPYWDFYEMDDSRSTFSGAGSFAGKTINLTHRPATYQYGFQFGVGANDFTADFGFSGWWSYTGDYSGHGDFNADLNCGSTPPSITYPASWDFDCDEDVCVEVLGVGTNGSSSASLSLTDVSTIDSIVVEAVSKGGTPDPSVVFCNSIGQELVALAGSVGKAPNGNNCSSCRTYRGTMAGAETITACDLDPSYNWSFTVYVFRSGANCGKASAGTLVNKYFYKGDETFTLPIDQTDQARDLIVRIPIAELSNDSRLARITLTAGGLSSVTEFTLPNLGPSLNITPITLANVPGSATSVSVKIESPDPGGDSFVVGGYIEVETDCENCILTDGGQIGPDQEFCGAFDPDPVGSISSPSGGNGNYEYEWFYSLDPNLPFDMWVAEENSNSTTFDPHLVDKTCWLVRQAKGLGCTDTSFYSNIVKITVKQFPKAMFTVPGGVCDLTDFDITAETANGSGVTYTWTFENGTPATATGQTVTANFPAAGTYDITLSVDRFSCVSEVTQPIMIDDCPICDNVTSAGAIQGGDATCVIPYDPAPITSKSLPSTGTGNLEFVWLMTTDPSLPQNQWTMIPNSNSPDFDPGPLSETTYFLRCVRRAGCNSFRESNPVAIEVTEGAISLCKPTEFAGGDFSISLDLREGTSTGKYILSPDDRKLLFYTDGTAKLEGLLIHTQNSNQRWYAEFWFESYQDWGEWDYEGRSFWAGNYDENHPAWDYYVLDATKSKLTGKNKFKNQVLNLSSKPASFARAFQFGEGANTETPDKGVYGKFFYTGDHSGEGELKISLEDCQDVCTPSPKVAMKVMMQGAYNPSTGAMNTAIATNNLLPNAQPFNIAPYSYAGTETITTTDLDHIVTWVLVQALDETNPSNVLMARAGLLSEDGLILEMNGRNLLTLEGLDPDLSYFFTVRSLNHLPVSTNFSIDRSGRVMLYDLTDLSKVYDIPGMPNAPMQDLGGGVYGMIAGDTNGDRVINASDYNLVVANYFSFLFSPSDVNHDVVTNASDLLLIVNNFFKFGLTRN